MTNSLQGKKFCILNSDNLFILHRLETVRKQVDTNLKFAIKAVDRHSKNGCISVHSKNGWERHVWTIRQELYKERRHCALRRYHGWLGKIYNLSTKATQPSITGVNIKTSIGGAGVCSWARDITAISLSPCWPSMVKNSRQVAHTCQSLTRFL